MPDYQKGQIYRLWSPHTDLFYIGSTCSPLSKRLHEHKKSYNHYLNEKFHFMSSFELFKFGDVKIELIENYQCNSKAELERREGHLIREHKNNIVNFSIAGRTQKEYHIDNKNQILEYKKEYCEQNKIEIRKQKKEYYEQNKDKLKKKAKEYYANKKALLSTEQIIVS